MLEARWPLIAKPVPRPLGSPSDTFPAIDTRSYGLRVMVGSSRIWVSLTVVAMSWVEVLIWAEVSPTTVTTSVWAPTVIWTLTATVAPTGTRVLVCFVEKPLSSAMTS